MDDLRYAQEMTDRYVYQVVRRLPAKGRGDIEAELRSLIADMVEERAAGQTPTRKDMDMVLAELGDPALFAGKYQGEPRSLIGPALFPQFLLVLKIVLAAVAGGMTIATFITAILSPSPFRLMDLAGWLANLFFSLGMAFTWVTLIFAFFEWRGIPLDFYTGEGTLPPVPARQETISRWEPISTIAFICLAMMVFLFLPQVLVAVISIGEEIIYFSIFDETALRAALPLILLSFGLGIVRECFKLLEGRYTLRLALGTIACDLTALLLTALVFGNKAIWNPDFGHSIDALMAFGPDFSFAAFWGYFTRFFVLIFLFAFLLDMGTMLFRALRYRDKKCEV